MSQRKKISQKFPILSTKKLFESDKKSEEKKSERQFFTADSPLPRGIQSDEDAKVFSKELLPGERKLLFDALRKITADQYNEHNKVKNVTIDLEDLKKVWYMNLVPMFVYGVLDEAFLIIGGDSINQIFSFYNGMSMLASAAVANVLCNLVLQLPVNRSIQLFGLKAPVLSADQMNTFEYKKVTIVARIIGLWLGLTLGMLPLFYIDENMYDWRGVKKSADWFSVEAKPWHRDLQWDEYCDMREFKEVSNVVKDSSYDNHQSYIEEE